MARDFEDIHDLGGLTDAELRELVRQHLMAHHALDIDELDVHVAGGTVRLEGRVGTDEERQIAGRVVTDVLGIDDLENDIFVDALRRDESPLAIDDHLAQMDREEGLLLGGDPPQQSDEVEQVTDDLDERLFGTTNVQKAIEGANSWIPPEGPTPEGPAGADEYGEDH